MHGRLKVRTSAELEAINKKKDEEKAKVYNSKMATILEKRKNENYDEEMLSLTADILHMNPDISTLWNIRKETLLQMRSNMNDLDSVVDAELKLTEVGLRINPKSYCAWHHRCWLLDSYTPTPNWEKELQICTRYLELDERNFHSWDYRRYVVERHRTQLQNELEYSLQKLVSNFSNYSAWHYRSKLIPRIYCAFEREKLFQNEVYKEEMSLVENAVYTDPNDQSAWFYHRWLLSHITGAVKIVQAGFQKTRSFAWIAIHPPAPNITVEGLGEGRWQFLNDENGGNVLIKSIPNVNDICDTTVKLYSNETNELLDSVALSADKLVVAVQASFKPVLSPVEEECLRQQLQSYKKLAELESDNKWTLLAINLINEKLGEQVDISVLEKLKSIDKLRKNYYSDYVSRLLMERKLQVVTNWEGSFVAESLSLTAFYHNHYFTLFQEVDLSDNPLEDTIFDKLKCLFSCKVLKLSNCQLTSLDRFPVMWNLRVLDISRNSIECKHIPATLLQCEHLEEINFLENTIDSNACSNLLENFPNLKITI